MKEVSHSQKNSRLAIVGKKNKRVDSRDKFTGRAVYADDIQLPGTLYAVLKRSTVAHGIIKNIDISGALAMDGVKAVLTGADLPVRFGNTACLTHH